jgi:cytochrome P450
MPYTEATMCEVMRKSAIVPFGLLHMALEDINFESYCIPKGSFMLCNLHHILNDPEYWESPETFRPERFLTFDGLFRRDERMIPFFMGKRSCPGESLAMLEYFLFFTGILQHFKFSLNSSEKIPDLSPRAGFILQPPKHELFVEMRNPLSQIV